MLEMGFVLSGSVITLGNHDLPIFLEYLSWIPLLVILHNHTQNNLNSRLFDKQLRKAQGPRGKYRGIVVGRTRGELWIDATALIRLITGLCGLGWVSGGRKGLAAWIMP